MKTKMKYCRTIEELAEHFSNGKFPGYYIQINYICGRPIGVSKRVNYLPMEVGRLSWPNIIKYIKSECHPGKYGATVMPMKRTCSKKVCLAACRLYKMIPEVFSLHLAFEVKD